MLMVEHILKNWHQIYEELVRWIDIIGTDWSRDKIGYTT